MSELKATTVYDVYWKANSVGEGTGILVYLKSEADKYIEELLVLNREQANSANRLRDSMERVIRHQKRKRCLAMAKWCDAEGCWYENQEEDIKAHWFFEWECKWLKIAEQFKEAK